MDEETILKKLERLFKMRRLLKEKKLKRIKDKKLKYGQWDFEDDEDDYEDDLLSRPELIEEALKEYMYEFGLSIYQNKQGDYFFKTFTDAMDIRDFDELDAHHFAMREREPNFIEKLLETAPEGKVQLLSNMEVAVLDLYEKDAVMSDIVDQIVNDEIVKCQEIIDGMEAVYETVSLEKAYENTKEIEKPTIDKQISVEIDNLELPKDSVYDENADKNTLATTAPDDATGTPPTTSDENWSEAYECGEERVEKARLPKPARVRRIREPENRVPVGLVKDNSNDR